MIINNQPPSQNHVVVSSRDVDLIYFDKEGVLYGQGEYITTKETMDEIICEVLMLLKKGKRPGLPNVTEIRDVKQYHTLIEVDNLPSRLLTRDTVNEIVKTGNYDLQKAESQG